MSQRRSIVTLLLVAVVSFLVAIALVPAVLLVVATVAMILFMGFAAYCAVVRRNYK